MATDEFQYQQDISPLQPENLQYQVEQHLRRMQNEIHKLSLLIADLDDRVTALEP